MTNAYVKLKQILPPAPVLVGLVTAHHEDDTSTVVLPTQEGRIEYAAGVAVGSTIRARGTTVPVGDKAFVRNGVIETRAPDGDPIEIEVGRVVPPPVALTFSGPIADQEGTVDEAFTSLDVSGYWSGGVTPLAFSLAEGALPDGLTLSSAGVISGTPTTEETATGLVIRATDQAGYWADSNAFDFDVEAPAGLWAAVGASGSNRAMSSPDGITWTARTASSVSRQWADVAFGNGVFVAVSVESTQAGKVMTSPDGITWTARSGADAAGNWHSVAFGAGVFVAVRDASPAGTQRVMTSPDGITWTLRTHPSALYLRSVAFGAGLFVALSNSGGAITSPDGITWTARTTPTPTGAPAVASWKSVAYSATLGMFAAVGELFGSTNVMTSPDGITWTLRTNPAETQGWVKVREGPGGMFVAVNSATGGTPYTETLYSADGTAWTAGSLPAPGAGIWQALAYNGVTLLAVSSDGVTARSTDGINWTAGTSVSVSASGGWQAVCWGTPA